MTPSLDIQEVSVESQEPALRLLERFFLEEGFTAPGQDLRASLHAMVTSRGSAVFLAWRGQEAVGVATVTASVGLEYGRSAELEDLYVLPQQRGSGVGVALVDAVCAWCRRQDVAVVLVTVARKGAEEHGLLDYYRRQGFHNTERVVLERTLGAPP